jgi:hypothetical protein
VDADDASNVADAQVEATPRKACLLGAGRPPGAHRRINKAVRVERGERDRHAAFLLCGL